MFFALWRLVRPRQDGERAERLINALFGAKDGGQHHQERTSASTSLRRMIRRCALATLIYDNMVLGPKSGIFKAQRRIVQRKLVKPNARS